MNNPIEMFAYMVKTLWQKVTGDEDVPADDGSIDNADGGLSTTATFIILGSVFCLMNFFVIYCAIQYYRYQS